MGKKLKGTVSMKENEMHKIIQEEIATILMIPKGCKVLNMSNFNKAEFFLKMARTYSLHS